MDEPTFGARGTDVISMSTGKETIVEHNMNEDSVDKTESSNLDTWSSILSGVASSKSVISHTVLILGGPKSGKSTLIERLESADGQSKTLLEGEKAKTSHDLALGFSYIDIADEDSEDLLARLSIYQISSTEPSLAQLSSFALNSETIVNSIVLILLDWERPWMFLESLKRWILMLQQRSMTLRDESVEGVKMLKEMKETVERYFRKFTDLNAPTSISAPLNDEDMIPLSDGVLTENLGLRICVVCTKSDVISILEKERDFKEEQIDYIQQALRTICLRYGATLIYTSHAKPETFSLLRQYILHRLLHTPLTPTLSHANQVDKDTVYIPSGWDSYGKIRILREGFDCEKISSGWDIDVKLSQNQPHKMSATAAYQEIILDDDIDTRPMHIEQKIAAEDEQVFLEKYYEVLKEANTEALKNMTTETNAKVSGELGPSLVGPMVASPITHQNLGSQTTLFEEDTKRLPRTPSTGRSPVTNTISSVNSNANGGSPSQNEVLANFFQSLLEKKAASANAAHNSSGGRPLPVRSQTQRTPSPSSTKTKS